MDLSIDFILKPGDMFSIEWSGEVRAVIADGLEGDGIRIRELTPGELAAMAEDEEQEEYPL